MIDAYAEFRQSRLKFGASVAVPIVVMAVLQLLPKNPIFGDTARLLDTIIFFLSALWLNYAFTNPLENYLETQAAWRYEGAGPTITMTVKKLEVRYMSFVRLLANVANITVLATALYVLSLWPPFGAFAPFQLIFRFGAFAGLAGFAIAIYRGRDQMVEVLALRGQLRDQISIERFTPASRDPERDGRAVSGESITILGPSEFQAGGIDWKIRDFYQSLIVFGKSGSGKTICVLNALLDGLIRSSATTSCPPSGLILDPKGDFKAKIRFVMRSAGRESDLIVFGPDDPNSVSWNPFDTDDDALEVANRFGAVFDVLGRSDKDAHFVTQSKMFIQASLTLIRLLKPPGEPPSAQDIVAMMGNAKDRDELIDQAASRMDLTPDQEEWRKAAVFYFDGTWNSLGDDERGSMMSTLTGALMPFLNPPYGKLMGSRTTVPLYEIIDSGKVLYVDFNIADRGAMARIACTLLKAEFGRQVLRREGKDRPSFLFCDEF